MQNLIDTLKIVQERIEKHEENLKCNETLTRYALIDPLLRALDWNLEDPDILIPEDVDKRQRRTDYSFGDRIMILEAKPLNQPLDKYLEKLKQYMHDRRSVYGILTNGNQWKTYQLIGQKPTHLNEFNVTDSLETIIPKIVCLHKQVIMPMEPSETDICEHCNLKFNNKKDLSAHINKIHVSPPPPESDMVVLLSDYKYIPGSESPKKLIICDKHIKITAWRHIITEVSRYLIKNKYITISNCPIPKLGNYIISTTYVHESGKKFVSPKKVNEFYVELNASSETSIKNSIKLINHVGADLSKFKLQF